MNCEICGIEIKGEPYKTKLDNSIMITCKECSKYGKVQRRPQQPKTQHTKKQPQRTPQRRHQTPKRHKEEEYELIDDYEKIIRQKRENMKLTQKKLGEKIYERESVIAHIESGKMVPDNRLAHKIEKALNIKIIEKIESNEREFQDVKRFRGTTIGDIVNIKRK